MKERSEVVKFVDAQLKDDSKDIERMKNRRHHYGKQELKALLDFIYGGEPCNDSERLAVSLYTKP